MTYVKLHFNQAEDRIAEYAGLEAADIAEATDDLRSGRTNGAIFRGAIDEETRKYAVSQLDACAEKETYHGLDTLGKIGGNLFEAGLNPFLYADYFRKAQHWQQLSRSMFPEGKYPIDRVRTMLDDEWDKGCGLLRLEDGIAFSGLMRFIDNGAGLFPHNDCIGADLPNSLLATNVDVQLALNVMLQRPEAGGETRIYPRIFSRSEYDANRLPVPDHYGVRTDALPAPVTIRAEEGDAYLFNAAHIHEVMPCSGAKTRYTLSTFIGVRKDGSLALFS
ncbi:2OG-Fe(II) oxygenase [Erythrobacter sp. YT30]|uniref:2OG-Fe(II)-dependent halogenase WelO5 family protein n=1 Tax=Erythrobacter sp. YT30 TaxID=1735012 RepID=UPI00076DB966|nr:2OG-Fe(II) oxygenase [Erythrobacter sp. YT30]KWV91764.1 hypothetical protein AUC45_11205 [Erythrobacter sp. YT30]